MAGMRVLYSDVACSANAHSLKNVYEIHVLYRVNQAEDASSYSYGCVTGVSAYFRPLIPSGH